MINFEKLTPDNMPEPFVLCLCKRNIKGATYLSYRTDDRFSQSEDPSGECYWFGMELTESVIPLESGKIDFQRNFNDSTVDSWAYLKAENLLSL